MSVVDVPAGLVPVPESLGWNWNGVLPVPEVGPQEEHHVPRFLCVEWGGHACMCVLLHVPMEQVAH